MRSPAQWQVINPGAQVERRGEAGPVRFWLADTHRRICSSRLRCRFLSHVTLQLPEVRASPERLQGGGLHQRPWVCGILDECVAKQPKGPRGGLILYHPIILERG